MIINYNIKILLYSIMAIVSQIARSQNNDINIYVTKTKLYKPFDKAYKIFELSLKVKDLKIDANHLVQIKNSVKAVTDTGKELEQIPIFMDDDFINTNNLKIAFKKTPEQSKSIDLLQGTIAYFQVSEKNNSLFTINDILHKYHINLLKRSPLKLKLVLINETHFLNLRWKNLKAYAKTLQDLKEKEKIGDSIDDFFKQLFSEAPLLDQPFEDYYKENLVFYIEDKENLFFDIQIVNNQAERVDTGYSIIPSDHKLIVSLKKGVKSLDKNLTVKIKLKTPASIRELKFMVTDIKLNY